jgi:hypothetical protein
LRQAGLLITASWLASLSGLAPRKRRHETKKRQSQAVKKKIVSINIHPKNPLYTRIKIFHADNNPLKQPPLLIFITKN